MQHRKLGSQGEMVGEMGLGCWQFGGDFGPMDEATALEILHAAIDSGTNFLDTADVYGGGRSESIIGKFLKQSGAKAFVATKFGRGDGVFPNGYTRAALRAGIVASMKRLQVDVLDLVQLHCIPTEVLRQGEVFDWLRELQKQGIVRHFGASVESIEQGLICLEQPGLLSLQVIFNLFRQKLATDLLPQAAANGVGIIVRLPLASGLLAGKFTAASTFPETDHRNYNRDGQFFNVGETFAGLPFAKGVELAEGLRPLVPEGMTMAQMALRWILDHSQVTVVIPGASSPRQARGNSAASTIAPLSESMHAKLSAYDLERVRPHIRGPY